MSDATPRTILVPTDFSEHSRHALAYAASLGERFGATLHILHVVTLHGYEGAPDSAAMPDVEPLLAAADRAARQHLDAGALDHGAAEAKVVKVVERGVNAGDSIVDYARGERIDLVVMAMHSGSRVARFLLGSVTERVLRLAPCPVLVVEKGDRDFLDPATMAVTMGTVVVADDLSEKTAAALSWAASWLGPYRPQIHVIHAVEFDVPAPYVMAGVGSVFELDRELRRRLEGNLRERAAAAFPPQWTVQVEVREGQAHSVVPAFAAEIGADLLVVAGETQIDLAERILGGTVERIARSAPCPMLVC